jgi:hypothetical protein
MILRLSLAAVAVLGSCHLAASETADVGPEPRAFVIQEADAVDSPPENLGSDDDLAIPGRARGRAQRRFPATPPNVTLPPDPLAGSPQVDPSETASKAEIFLARMLPQRTDSPADWHAPVECLHDSCEPYALPPCVPPPPCHPSEPPHPLDLVGVRGVPTGGPIYGGPCCPRTGSHDHCSHPHAHRVRDRFFDWFYTWK